MTLDKLQCREHRVKVKESERGSKSRSFGESLSVSGIENLGERKRERFGSCRSPSPEECSFPGDDPNAAASVLLVCSRQHAGKGSFEASRSETKGAPRERLDHSRPGRRPRTIRSSVYLCNCRLRPMLQILKWHKVISKQRKERKKRRQMIVSSNDDRHLVQVKSSF